MAWFEDADIDLLARAPVHALTVTLLLVHLARDQRRTTQGRLRPPAVGSTIDRPAAPAPGRREAT
jgi:hypothetical protein